MERNDESFSSLSYAKVKGLMQMVRISHYWAIIIGTTNVMMRGQTLPQSKDFNSPLCAAKEDMHILVTQVFPSQENNSLERCLMILSKD